MEIKLLKLSLVNFKGVKSESFEFLERETFIHGANGTGKTTLFDSFIWCLFGKDHLGRTDYQLKTWDKSGKTKPKAFCEVEAVIKIDGKVTTLRRVYAENWVKPKGEESEVFKGNETIPHINDVKVTMGEYNALVASWCNETVFKSITNPHYFPSLSKDEQRTILFAMCGEISNESVAGDNQAFKDLLLEITGVSFEAYRKELLAKKRRVNEELGDIEPRIDELKRTMPEIPNMEVIKKELEQKQSEIMLIEKSIADIVQRFQSSNSERLQIQSKVNELERENQIIEFEEKQKQDKAIQDVKIKISELERKISESKNLSEGRERLKLALVNSKNVLTSQLNELRAKYQEIVAEKLTYSDKAFICPTCERLLEVEDIEAKQAQLNANFNNDKAKRIEENKKKGLSVKAELEEIEKKIAEISEVSSEVVFMPGTKMDALKDELAKVSVPIAFTKTQLENFEKIKLYKENLEAPQEFESSQKYIQQKLLIQVEIDDLKSKLNLKSVVENTNIRISQLESQYKTLNQELAGYEKKEFTLKEFEFAKNTEYEARINKMFEFTKFKLFHTQVDGQIIQTCECMVDGTPYSTLNNAMQYGAGLDIINTISKFNDKYAPIWLDNRESVTEIPEMKTQVINLVVDKRAKRIIERSAFLAKIKAEEEAKEKERLAKLLPS